MSSDTALRPSRSRTPTPLWAVNLLTFLTSIGTGVVWNGIAFIAKHDFQFHQSQTLTLYFVLGATYIVGAISTGPVLRRLERWLSPRAALGLILAAQAMVCLGLGLVHTKWMLWLVACAMSVLASWLWPIVESYLTAGRHGAAMRHAIGWWNLTWTGAVAFSLLLMAPLMSDPPPIVHLLDQEFVLRPGLAIVLLGGLNAVAVLVLVFFKAHPGSHDDDQAFASVQREYPFLLRAARILLPLSYVLNAAMSPLLPYLFERLDLVSEWETPVTSTWMWVRIIAMAIMWQIGFWHGRWGTLLLGAISMAIGFGLIVAGFSIATMVAGFALFGAGMGIIYYAALYYAMAVGRAAVDAGGTHEALIGLGYAVGPLTGLASLGLAAENEQRFSGLVIGMVWTLIIAGSVEVLRTYHRARQGRSSRP